MACLFWWPHVDEKESHKKIAFSIIVIGVGLTTLAQVRFG
jgi:hypothetical protein